MVWLNPVAVLVLFVGISQAEYCDPTTACSSADMPKNVPATAEEFDQFCKLVVPFVECSLKAAEECDPEMDIYKLIERVSPIMLRMCNNESLLNKAIKESIECFHSNMEEIFQCAFLVKLINEETLKDYVDSLSENGVTLTGEEVENLCPQMLYATSCMAARSGQICGDVTRAVVIELSQGLDILHGCNAETSEKLNIAVDVMETQLPERQALQALFVQE